MPFSLYERMRIMRYLLSLAVIIVVITLISLFEVKAYANNFRLFFPLDCAYGVDCWAVNYVDVDPSSDRKDYKCNAKSYDGHKGTDFAVGSISEINAGVDVLAAADGKVLRIRDGEQDFIKNKEQIAFVKKQRKECGNAVLIDHANGYQTIYCHLKNGSVTVSSDQEVKAGDKIAQMGISGVTEFPHLHIGVTHDGNVLDPYTGATNQEGCAKHYSSLWSDKERMTYEPAVIFNGGFDNTPPDFDAITNGKEVPSELYAVNSNAFVFWAGFYNIEPGDIINFVITMPDGAVFHKHTITADKTRSRQYYFIGRKIKDPSMLPAGTYQGIVTLERQSEKNQDIILNQEFSVLVR